MKLSKIILPIVCLCTLASCGIKTTKEKYLESMAQCEDHQFKTIVIDYIYENNSSRCEIKITYTFKNNAYEPDEINSFSTSLIEYTKRDTSFIKEAEEDFESYSEVARATDIDAKIDREIVYRVDPFQVKGSFKSSFKYDSYKISGAKKRNFTYEHNKYGYLTLLEDTYSYEYTETKNGIKEETDLNEYRKIKISYND